MNIKDDILALPSLRQTVNHHNILTKKKFGQNFLFDLNLTDKIARCAGNIQGKTVLEIGPGPGGLTRAILMREPAKLIVIEKDPDCLPALHPLQQLAGEQMQIIQDDALTLDEGKLAGGKLLIIANLPYNIGTELIFKWLDNITRFDSITVMLQKEVAERITAAPGSKAYGTLSVIAQWLCHAHLHMDIPPEAFYPPPKVTSSVITLTPREEPLAPAEMHTLKQVVKAVFGQRRKMLRASLKQRWEDPVEVLEHAGIDPQARPESLTVEDFCRLAGYTPSL